MRLGDGRSVTDDAERRLIDQSARRRTSPCLVDFTTINDSDRRDRRGADRPQLNTLWDKRTGDNNRPSVNEPAGRIVSEAGITYSVSTFPVCLRWILTENVIAANGNDRASQQMVQDATTVVAGLSRGRFCRRTVLAADDLFFALGIAR